jgi:hypothetical protein
MDYRSTEVVSVREGDPLSAFQQIRAVTEFQRAKWRTRVETESLMTADAMHFHVSNHMDAYEGETHVFSKSWNQAIPRDHG